MVAELSSPSYHCNQFVSHLQDLNYNTVVTEASSRIPEHCKACPAIFYSLSEYLNLEAELHLLQNNSEIQKYRDFQDIETRARELVPQVGRLADELVRLEALTVGCTGVKFARVILDGEFIDHYQCQSPLNKD